MRIGLITGEYPPDEGGIGDFTHRLACALCEQEHTVHILADRRGAAVSRETNAALSVDRVVDGWGWSCHRQIRSWAGDLRLDVLNLQYEAAAFDLKAPITLVPCRLAGGSAPIVTTFHDLMPPYLFPKAGPLRQRAVWTLARCSAGVIVTNEADRADLSQALSRPSPIEVIPIGSNILPQSMPAMSKDEWRLANRFASDALIVGFFGFLNRNKGIETLLTAVAQLHERGTGAEVLFIGGRIGSSDPSNVAYAKEIEELIARLCLDAHVHWTGFADPVQVSMALQAVDLVVLPYREGASLRHGTLHAALAHGTSIVSTTPRFAIPELRHGENMLLTPPGDPEALCDSMELALNDPALRARLACGAAELGQRFSWSHIAEHTARFFAECARRSTGGTGRPA